MTLVELSKLSYGTAKREKYLVKTITIDEFYKKEELDFLGFIYKEIKIFFVCYKWYSKIIKVKCIEIFLLAALSKIQ